MVSLRTSRPHRVSAEAAAWIARLQSPDCCPETEAALADWLELDAAHRQAFDRATEVWGMIPAAALRQPATIPPPAPVRRPREAMFAAPAARRWAPALAACLLVLLAVGGMLLLGRPGGFSTAIGEQQMATLGDGTRITLNTDTRLHVRYADDLRSVALDRGEAMFEVAPNPRRPFVVTAGDTKVRALGTSFIVRRERGSVTVTLIQGKVSVTNTASRPGLPQAAASTILAPGERLTVTEEAGSLIDRPSIEAVTAWRRGQAVFADTPLSEAVAELNRYGGPHVALGDPRLASLRVSGVFATNDTVEFATAIAALHGLQVNRSRAEVVIAR